MRFIKADVDGSEREVLDGALATIARDRPVILLELLSSTHDETGAYTTAICESFGYAADIIQDGQKNDALPAIAGSGQEHRLGDIESRNVLFLPR